MESYGLGASGPPLRIGLGNRLDRNDEVHRIRSRRYPTPGGSQSAFTVVLSLLKRAAIFCSSRSCRGHYRDPACPSTMVPKSSRDGWRPRNSDVRNYFVILVFDSRMGTKSWRLSCSFGHGRAISSEGRGSARSGDLVIG